MAAPAVVGDRFPTQYQDGLSAENRIKVDAGIGDEVRRGAHRLLAEVKIPRCLADRPFQFRVRVLPFRQHARPEGHVAEIPSGREGIRIPGMSPNMANAIAGSAFDGASGIARPGPLGCGVVIQPDFPPLPRGAIALVASRIVLAAVASPVRVAGRVLPDPVGVDKVGVLKCGLEDCCAAALEIASERLNRRNELAAVYAGSGQNSPPALRASGVRPVAAPLCRGPTGNRRRPTNESRL